MVESNVDLNGKRHAGRFKAMPVQDRTANTLQENLLNTVSPTAKLQSYCWSGASLVLFSNSFKL